MSINDELIGLRHCDVENVPCRTCKNAFKGGIGKATCLFYDDIETNSKPDEVYFDNEPCTAYISGEDLLPFEIIL